MARPVVAERDFRQHVRRQRERHADRAALPSGTVAATSSSSSSTSSTSASTSSSSSTSIRLRVLRSTPRAMRRPTPSPRPGTAELLPAPRLRPSSETMIPLVAFAHFKHGHTPLSVNHSGLFVSSTISFNLTPGASLGAATAEIEKAVSEYRSPRRYSWQLARRGGNVSVFERQRAAADRRGAGGGLHRPWRSL